MPADALHDLFGDPPEVGKVDVRAVIRRSRRRRLPARVGVGAVATVAAVGIVTGAGFGLKALGGVSTSAGSSSVADGAKAPESGPQLGTGGSTRPTPLVPPLAQGGTDCASPALSPRTSTKGAPSHGTTSEGGPSQGTSDLRLSIAFPAVLSLATTVLAGTITVTNCGTAAQPVRLGSPLATLVRDGAPGWTGTWPTALLLPDDSLAPGESTFVRVVLIPTGSSSLGSLPAGVYRLSITATVVDGANAPVVSASPVQIRLGRE